MCGRYANSRHDGDLLADFAVASVVDPPPPPSWNVAPTMDARVILERLVDDVADRQLRTLRWGLVPPWAKDLKIGARLINARSETITSKPAFAKAAARRRCLVPADGYYEWMATDDRKVPMFLHSGKDTTLAMAGLYEIRPAIDDPQHWLWTYTIVTCQTQDALGHVHDRSPVVVPPDLRDAWLDPAMTNLDGVRDLIDAMPPPVLDVYEVSTDVNSVRNDNSSLTDPVE